MTVRALRCALTATALTLGLAGPAHALDLGTGGGGGAITTHADLGACATVTFPQPTTIVGEFTLSGVETGPGTITYPLAGSAPILVVNGRTWTGCLPGGYTGPVDAAVEYSVVATSPIGDFVSNKACHVVNRVLGCS